MKYAFCFQIKSVPSSVNATVKCSIKTQHESYKAVTIGQDKIYISDIELIYSRVRGIQATVVEKSV